MHFYNWLLFSFKGRINRRTFWLFQLAIFIFSVVLLLALGGDTLDALSQNQKDEAALNALMSLAWKINLVLLWPKLAVDVKRFQDRDKSWYWIFIQLIPMIGPLWYLVEAGFIPGTQGDNRFGAPMGQTQGGGSSGPDEGRFEA